MKTFQFVITVAAVCVIAVGCSVEQDELGPATDEEVVASQESPISASWGTPSCPAGYTLRYACTDAPNSQDSKVWYCQKGQGHIINKHYEQCPRPLYCKFNSSGVAYCAYPYGY